MVNDFAWHIFVEPPKATFAWLGVINAMTDLHVIGKETLGKKSNGLQVIMPKQICSFNGRHWHPTNQLLLERDSSTISAKEVTAIICTEMNVQKMQGCLSFLDFQATKLSENT